jgi:hypothetical protein
METATIKKYQLSNVALYAKGHYKRSGDVWADVKRCLIADDYQPSTQGDVVNIIINNSEPIFKDKDRKYMMLDLVDSIHPQACWKIGFFTKDFKLNKDWEKCPDYDYMTAILYFYLSKLSTALIKDLGDIGNADKKVLPLKK